MKRRSPNASAPSKTSSPSDEQKKQEFFRLLAHHYGDWKLVDGRYLIDVGGLADAISTGAIERVRIGHFDKVLLDRSADRVDGASRRAGRDFFPPALTRPPLAVIGEGEDVVVIDGHRRARQLFTSHGATKAHLVGVSLDDAMKYGKHVDELSPTERRLLETMRSHPVRFTADPDATSQGVRLVPVHIPPVEEGRPPAADEIGVLSGAFHALAREIMKRAKLKHDTDPRRRVRDRAFSNEKYLREIVVRLGEFSLTPNLPVAMSTLQAEYAGAVAELNRYSAFYLGRESALLDRLLDGTDDLLELRFVLLSRALAAGKWNQSHSKAFGALIDPLSHAKKRFFGLELSEKITGGMKRVAMRDLPLRALCDIARLVGINTAHLFPQVAHAHEIVEWYRLLFFMEHGRWRDISERSLAMNFTVWYRLLQIHPLAAGETTPPEIALAWNELFNAIAATKIPPDEQKSDVADLLELCLARSAVLFNARRDVQSMIWV